MKTDSKSTLLETRGLTVNFGGLVALRDVNFQVKTGYIHAIIGPNGAGKTTFFNAITGEFRPTSGQVFFKGKDISGLPPHVVTAKGIARKFQTSEVFVNLSVVDNIRLATERQGSLGVMLCRPKENQETDTILELMHLTDHATDLAGSLAHGERQRLELGMVLGTGAELLLLDEPTSGMSLEERDEIGDLLKSLTNRVTILITEHDFRFIKEVATVITVFNKGEKIAEGSVPEIEANLLVRQCYLGVC